MTIYIYRRKGAKEAWTDGELAILKRMYPHDDRLAILKKLPNRTWDAISLKAMTKGIARETWLNSAPDIDNSLAYADILAYQNIKRIMHYFPPLKNGVSVGTNTVRVLTPSYAKAIAKAVCNNGASSCSTNLNVIKELQLHVL